MKSLRLLGKAIYNGAEKRLRSLWRVLIGVGLAFLSLHALRSLGRYILASFLVVAGEMPLGTLGNTQQLRQRLDSAYEGFPLLGGIHSLIILLLVLAAFVLLARWIDRRPWRGYGFHFDVAWWRDLLFGLVLGTALMGAVFGTELVMGWVSIQGFFENGHADLPFWQLLTNGLVGFILVGVEEELFFRGFMIENIAEGLRFTHVSERGAVLIAFLLITISFGFAHVNTPNASLVSSLCLCVVGLLLGLGFVLTGELAIPIGLHIAWNFAQGYVFGFPVSGSDAHVSIVSAEQAGPSAWTGGTYGPEAGLLALIASLLGVALVYIWVRLTRKQATVKAEIAQYRA